MDSLWHHAPYRSVCKGNIAGGASYRKTVDSVFVIGMVVVIGWNIIDQWKIGGNIDQPGIAKIEVFTDGSVGMHCLMFTGSGNAVMQSINDDLFTGITMLDDGIVASSRSSC